MIKTKLLLGIGIFSLTFIPVVSVVSCSSSDGANLNETKEFTLQSDEGIFGNEEIDKWFQEINKKTGDLLGFDTQNPNEELLKNVNYTVEQTIKINEGSIITGNSSKTWNKGQTIKMFSTIKDGKINEINIDGTTIKLEDIENIEDITPQIAGPNGAKIKITYKFWKK